MYHRLSLRYNELMVRLKFTNHMQMRMNDRSIDMDHLKATIKKTDLTQKYGNGKVMVLRTIDKNRKLKVIYFKDGITRGLEDILIITAYYITQ